MFQDLTSCIFVLWPSFTLGILHTLQPCEDKTIFSFYAFGVSKDWHEALKLLNLYGAGLLTANLSIGLFASILGAAVFPDIPPVASSLMAGTVTIIAGVYMLYLVYKAIYDPHSAQKKEIGTVLTRKKDSGYRLGLLAGFPPCIMELKMYADAMFFSATYNIPVAIFAVIMFGIGTWIGLYPLSLLGAVGSRVRQRMESPWIIEKVSAWFMIGLGAIYLVLAFFGIYLFPQLIIPPQ